MCMQVCVCVCVCARALSRVWLCSPMDYSLPGSSVHRILQPRILEWVAMPSFRVFSQPRDWIQVLCLPHWQGHSLPSHLLHAFLRPIVKEVNTYDNLGNITVKGSITFLWPSSNRCSCARLQCGPLAASKKPGLLVSSSPPHTALHRPKELQGLFLSFFSLVR